jgi:hypothetical protein
MPTGYVKDFDWRRSTETRSGVIVYTYYQQKLLFGLGLDATYQQLTDFGGKKINREDVITCALREWREESFGIFEDPIKQWNKTDINDCVYVSDGTCLVIFVRLDVDPRITDQVFELQTKKTRHIEVSRIVWLDKRQLICELLPDKPKSRIYERVFDVLSANPEFLGLI